MNNGKEKEHAGKLALRDVQEADLDIFFTQQQDPQAAYMAAFTVEDPADRDAFDVKWARIMADDTVLIQTILFGDAVVGHVVKFEQSGESEVSYWIDRQYWGMGIATRALDLLLPMVPQRPLYALAAKDNIASIRVLQKCGFQIIGEGKGFANARGEEIEEYVLKLP